MSDRGRGRGRALALDTPIPTPTGWTTTGQVQAGDELLDERGMPCTVLATTEEIKGIPCYRVTFRDDTSIIAAAGQPWPVEEFTGASKRRLVTATTSELMERGVRYVRKLTTGRTKCTSDGVARWKTLPTPALQLVEHNWLLPPYLLGYWLGDGDSDQPRITIDKGDLSEFITRMGDLGVELGDPKVTGNQSGNTFRIRFNHDGYGSAMKALRSLGVLNCKHIPLECLRGSHEQRLDLLRGIMDSDGSIEKSGKIELTLTSPRLAEDCVSLMRTIGLYPRVNESNATLHGHIVGRRWRIVVTAFAEEPIFCLNRKAEKLRPKGRSIPYSQVRTILKVESSQCTPVRALFVSSKSRVYLAGEGLIPVRDSSREG